MSTKPRVQVPRSALAEVLWPALPGRIGATVLALQQQFEASQWWPANSLLALQLRQLGPLLVHAGRMAPFYQGRLGKEPGKPTPDTWDRIPVLERAQFQEAGPDLFSLNIPKGHGPVADVTTSGSTGRPVTVKSTKVTTLFLHALNLRYHLWHGRDFSAKVASITIIKSPHPKPRDWGLGYPSGPMVAFDVTRPTSEQLAWLADFGAEYLLTYPSNLRALALMSEEKGFKPPGLEQVSTMGEVLDDDIRQTCERAWGVPVTDVYSSQEVGVIAIQCPDHPHYHVQSESVLVEVLDEDGAPCQPGRVGRIVVTDLHNFASPIIRYAIGDYAEVGEPCPCGRGLPVLKRIMGRTRNMLTLPGGDKFWPVIGQSKLRDIAPVRQFQLVQKTLEDIELRLVVARELTADEEAAVKASVLEKLGHEFAISLIYFDEIPRTPGGKYEDIISEVG